jgi:DNA-directed RNA polymerase specialized sigma24 family protein
MQETESFEAEHNVHSKKAEIIKKYITNLKEPYRTVIEMREIDRMSYKDIADTLQKNLVLLNHKLEMVVIY